MQGISAKEHQLLVLAFQKFEKMASMANSKISDEEENRTKEGMAELRQMYHKFQALFSELDECTKEYKVKRKTVQSILNKNIRKMNYEVKKKSSKL